MVRQETFETGQKVVCQASFDNQPHPAEVLGRKQTQDGLLYYVHYLDCDKRLDEWVAPSQLQPLLANQHSLPLPHSHSLPAVEEGVKVTRHLKRKLTDVHHVPDDVSKDHSFDQEHAEKNKVKNVQTVEFGKYEMDTWYYSPYPEPYASCEHLYICEYTLKYFRKKKTLLRHLAKLDINHPPGDEIYRSPPAPPHNPSYVGGAVCDPPISVFEVDGKTSKVYCQNLCLLSKLFLDHKTLYYEVDPFLFYVLCERDEAGYHLVGYFSKEKCCMENYNLACILTLPAFQRRGYGKFLIQFAHELSRREGRIGTPERPLSDLGQVSFRSYWTRVLLEALRDVRGELSVEDLSRKTFIMATDVTDTLQALGLLKYIKGSYYISASQRVVEEHLRSLAASRGTLELDPACLHWTPLQSPGQTGRKK